MQAAVLRQYGTPDFGEFPDPEPGPGLEVVTVRAATINAVDVAAAAGTHYLKPTTFPVVPGIEGVGTLTDGRRVYFGRPVPPYGSMAQRTLVPRDYMMEVPDGVDDAVAAALGNAGMAALMPLQWRAALQPGERVLVLGATGVVGRLAIQAARLLDAGTIVAAGRDPAALAEVKALGADATVRLTDDNLTDAFQEASGGAVDVIIDYTWGEPAVHALGAGADGVRLVQVGDRASATAALPAQRLRNTGATIFGFMPVHAGPAAMRSAYQQMVDWAIAGKLTVDVEILPLRDVADGWKREQTTRRKLVVRP